MNAVNLLQKLRSRSVFSVQDIERIADCDRDYAKQVLLRLKERRLIKRVMRNVYTTKDDIYTVASNITYPSYMSFWSASSFLGYTEQVLNVVQMAATRRVNTVRFEGWDIKFVPLRHFFGYRKVRTDNGELFVADDEKLMIDAFLRPDECGNIDEIEKIFSNAKFSERKLVGYLRRIGSQSVTKRVGFLLEKTRGTDISGHFAFDRNYVMLDQLTGRYKKSYAKWRVKA